MKNFDEMQLLFHALIGVLLAGTGFWIQGDAVPMAIVFSSIAGSVVPDLDMFFIHRKTLHFPVVFSIVAMAMIPVYIYTGALQWLILFFFVAGAGLHSLIDVFGGGKEMRPWERKDNRAVYNHVSGEWVRPRHWYYDGSRISFALGLMVSILVLALGGPFLDYFVGAVLLFSSVYMLIRRQVVEMLPEEYERWSQFIKHRIWGGDPERLD